MLTIICGNGGDYEFERDRYLWKEWIKQNITLDGFSVKFDDECAADQARIIFDDPGFEIIFKLKAPPRISPEDIGLKGIV